MLQQVLVPSHWPKELQNPIAVFQPGVGLNCVDCAMLMLLRNRFHVLHLHNVLQALCKLTQKVFLHAFIIGL